MQRNNASEFDKNDKRQIDYLLGNKIVRKRTAEKDPLICIIPCCMRLSMLGVCLSRSVVDAVCCDCDGVMTGVTGVMGVSKVDTAEFSCKRHSAEPPSPPVSQTDPPLSYS